MHCGWVIVFFRRLNGIWGEIFKSPSGPPEKVQTVQQGGRFVSKLSSSQASSMPKGTPCMADWPSLNESRSATCSS